MTFALVLFGFVLAMFAMVLTFIIIVSIAESFGRTERYFDDEAGEYRLRIKQKYLTLSQRRERLGY